MLIKEGRSGGINFWWGKGGILIVKLLSRGKIIYEDML